MIETEKWIFDHTDSLELAESARRRKDDQYYAAVAKRHDEEWAEKNGHIAIADPNDPYAAHRDRNIVASVKNARRRRIISDAWRAQMIAKKVDK